MAYTYDPNDPNQKVSQTPATLPQPKLGLFDPNAGPAPTMQDEGRGTDRFINFSRIFNANAGAARQGANALADRVGGQGRTAQGALDDAQTKFEHDKDAGSVKFQDGTFIPPEMRDGDAGSFALPGTEETGSGPRFGVGVREMGSKKQGLDSEDSRRITREEAITRSNTKYTGPLTMGSDALQAQTMDAASQARGIADFNQRQAMLGNSKLNAALTGASGNKMFGGKAKRFGGLHTRYNNLVANDTQEALDAAQLTKAGAAQYGDLVKTFDADAEAQRLRDINNDPHRHITADIVGTADEGWKDIDQGLDDTKPIFGAFGFGWAPDLMKLGVKGWKQYGDKPGKRQYEKEHGLAPGSLGNND